MDPASVVEAVAGGLLLFVVPGLTVSRALFPEWTFRGPSGARRAVETAALSFVLSVALTVVVGSLILGWAPGGFSAAWSDPVLEAGLAAVSVVALAVGLLRGAYSRRAMPTQPAEPGGERAWEVGRALDALERRRRTLLARRSAGGGEGSDARDIDRELLEVEGEVDRVRRAREEEYAD